MIAIGFIAFGSTIPKTTPTSPEANEINTEW